MGAGRDRRAGGRRSRPGRTTSSSRTTPTRTWSGTPACGTRRSPRCRRSTRASIASWTPSPTSRRPIPMARARSSPSPPTTATPMSCGTPIGAPVTAHSLNPVPFVLVGRAAAGRHARGRRPRRRRAHDPRAGRSARLAGDHRADRCCANKVGRAGVVPSAAVSNGGPRTRESHPGRRPAHRQRRADLRRPAAVPRHGPVGGTFGGDSAVYRSRRGIERRLWQFTIVLLVLFVDLLDRVIHPGGLACPRRPSRAG